MSALIAALASDHGLPTVDADTLQAFLEPAAGEPDHALLFFTGDPEQRTDSGDVAVVDVVGACGEGYVVDVDGEACAFEDDGHVVGGAWV